MNFESRMLKNESNKTLMMTYFILSQTRERSIRQDEEKQLEMQRMKHLFRRIFVNKQK
jgi:hypothetical protein